jgi:hypothetical protein
MLHTIPYVEAGSYPKNLFQASLKLVLLIINVLCILTMIKKPGFSSAFLETHNSKGKRSSYGTLLLPETIIGMYVQEICCNLQLIYFQKQCCGAENIYLLRLSGGSRKSELRLRLRIVL